LLDRLAGRRNPAPRTAPQQTPAAPQFSRERPDHAGRAAIDEADGSARLDEAASKGGAHLAGAEDHDRPEVHAALLTRHDRRALMSLPRAGLALFRHSSGGCCEIAAIMSDHDRARTVRAAHADPVNACRALGPSARLAWRGSGLHRRRPNRDPIKVWPMNATSNPRSAGLDFGTTNSVAALSGGAGAETRLLLLEGPGGPAELFRSALCFWHDEAVRGGLAVAAGPAAIHEYLDLPSDSRFLQSFKSVAASRTFETVAVFDKRFRFEELGRLFLDKLSASAAGQLGGLERLVVGRPVEYAGSKPDPALARERYDGMFGGFAREVQYVYEPLGAAFSYASRLTRPAVLLVADFGGGTSDFSVVQVGEPGTARRCRPLGHAGIGIAGDRFDYRIVDRLILPMLGKGGHYRSFDKVLEIPGGYFADFGDWAKLALMRNRRTLAELDRLRRSALDPEAISRMILMIENELGFPLYDAVGRLKRELSQAEQATFRFSGAGLKIEAEVTRSDFESWIAPDVEQIAATVDRAMAAAGLTEANIDRVFLTGGTSLVPLVRSIFTTRFGAGKVMSGGELTSIAHGLALIAGEEDLAGWAA
jgi:hypothetical chaperone protein